MRKILRFIFSGALVLLLAIIGVLLFNTLSKRSSQLTVTTPPPFAFDEQAAAQRLAGAIPIRTTAHFLNPRYFASVSDNILRFMPVRTKPGDLARFHGTNERLSIENYAEMIRFYRRLMQNAAG